MLRNIIIIIILFISIYFLIPTYISKLIYKIKKYKNKKTIFLTFDDGPSIYTNYLLDILKKYNVEATFFCVGDYTDKNKDIVKREIKENHLVGLHSLNHTNANLLGIKKTFNDFNKCLDIMNNLNIKIKYFRPPWGHLNLLTLINLKKNKLKLVLWNVMAEDWKSNTTPKIIESKLLKRIKGGDIICLHDGRGSNNAPLKTIEALDNVIPKLLEKGYVFKTIDKYYEN